MATSPGKRRAGPPAQPEKSSRVRKRTREGSRVDTKPRTRVRAKPENTEPRRPRRALPAADSTPSSSPTPSGGSRVRSLEKWNRPNELTLARGPQLAIGVVLALAGAVALGAAALGIGPAWIGLLGSIGVATVYSFLLALRTGGRPLIFALLAFMLASGAALSGQNTLLAGASVMLCAVTAVLAVMITVPAQSFFRAALEMLLGLLVSVLGGLAVLGFEPTLSMERFRVVASAVAFVMVFALVYRLGAGWHGLGRRGLVLVGLGFAVLVLMLTYTVLLQRYGSPAVVTSAYAAIENLRDTLGALPRPVQAFVGIPALIWGTHMRARRRQGWWVCAFGVGAAVPVVYVLARAASWREFALSQGYSLLIGILLGFLLIRLDLRVAGNRGRRSRIEEQEAAIRPEPRRTQPLFGS